LFLLILVLPLLVLLLLLLLHLLLLLLLLQRASDYGTWLGEDLCLLPCTNWQLKEEKWYMRTKSMTRCSRREIRRRKGMWRKRNSWRI